MVLYFRADWCGPCRQASKVFEELKLSYPNVEFRKIDVDEDAETANAYGIRAIPTMILLKDGRVEARATGARPARETATILGL